MEFFYHKITTFLRFFLSNFVCCISVSVKSYNRFSTHFFRIDLLQIIYPSSLSLTMQFSCIFWAVPLQGVKSKKQKHYFTFWLVSRNILHTSSLLMVMDIQIFSELCFIRDSVQWRNFLLRFWLKSHIWRSNFTQILRSSSLLITMDIQVFSGSNLIRERVQERNFLLGFWLKSHI